MNSKEIIKYLKNSIGEKGNYCYSLPIEITRKTIKCIKEKDREIERLNNIIKKLERLVDDYAWNSYYIKCGNRYLKSEILNDIREIIELKGSNGTIPPEVIGTNGEDGGLFDYGDR